MFNIKGIVLPRESLWRHCTLLIGGPADFYAIPADENDLRALLTQNTARGLDCFILGGGSNLLAADAGIRGLVINTRSFDEYRLDKGILILGGGLEASAAAWKSGTEGLEGLEFLFGMPGTIGGAIWMNARCYDREVADLLEWVDVMAPSGEVSRLPFDASQWSYKVSPFQNSAGVILRAGFRVTLGDAAALRQTMRAHHSDRAAKGHYRAPCAGSAFKNNRAYGAPSGEIIDRCGLKGFRVGRAAVSEWHANIFVNLGGAAAAEFRELLDMVAERVENETGYRLEAEILSVGEG